MSIVEEIAAERRRQVETEGWTTKHDDAHSDGAMALAAACYAFTSTLHPTEHDAHIGALYALARGFRSIVADLWPRSWASHWFKPKDRRRDLVRAGALIVAEIERIDRADYKDRNWATLERNDEDLQSPS